MREVILKTELHRFKDCAAFAREFSLGAGDLIFTIRPIYENYFEKLKLPVKTLFWEDFGSGEPTDLTTDAIIEAAAKLDFKRLIAVGGGSVVDIAKVVAASGGRKTDELYADPASIKRLRQFVIVPTTCGTGSEVTNISIINRSSLGVKMGLVSDALFADQAALIPELLMELPFDVFAASSIDALVHAVESALSPKATDFTKMLSYRAIEIIIKNYIEIKEKGREARLPLLDSFLTASNYAGIAFGTAGCAAVHALSYPLGGSYHVPHGESNYAVFTGVMKNYLEIKDSGEISKMMSFISSLLRRPKEESWDALEELLNEILHKKALHEYGVKETELEEFADSVMQCQQRLLANNFVPLDRERVLKIYMELY
ncbi:MAG: 4-hydroxybutyrate dehydrogenase [Synergistaceae bacterium]|nr:4-hydroxybutyrate dehydrogenase [Synergistaceae bacterium]